MLKKLIVNKYKIYYAEKIIKKDNSIRLINAKQEVDGVFEDIGDILFPNISNIDEYQLEEGQEWDLPEDVAETNYLLDLDFRLSKLELGL